MAFVHASEFRRFVKYCVSGFVAGVPYLALYYGLTKYAGVWYITSSIPASILHIIIKTILVTFWTFENRDTAKTHHQLGQYFALEFINFALNTVLLYLFVEYAHLGYMLAQCIVAALLAVEGFAVGRWVIFPAENPE
jgi:putative flippase GtrA